MRFFATPRELRERGVLGMNQRNADYIMRYNPRRLYPLVDNKLETKKLALERGIAVPELYGVIAIEHQVQEMASILADHQALVIKPSGTIIGRDQGTGDELVYARIELDQDVGTGDILQRRSPEVYRELIELRK